MRGFLHIAFFSHFFCTKKHDFSEKIISNATEIGNFWKNPKKKNPFL